MIVIANKSIVHPCCPVKHNNQRVREYWSYMVIKPSTNNFKKPGLEYVLTYFDNPGVVLPPAITSWVAQKQMPDFLNKLYCATLEYAKQRKDYDVEVNFICTNPLRSRVKHFLLLFSTSVGIVFLIQASNIHQIL